MEGPSKPNSVFDRALHGRIDLTEYRSFVINYVKDHNSTHGKEFDVKHHHLEFDLQNGLVPVAELRETQNPDKYRSDIITVTNHHKKKLYYCMDILPNPKYELTVEPLTGVIPAGKTVNITLKIRVFCTTRIYQVGRILFSLKNPTKLPKLYWPARNLLAKSEKDRRKSTMTGGEEQPPFHYITLRIESELSTSYDFDDLEFGQELAKGGFGTVYKAKWRGNEVAVKVLNAQELVPEEKELVQREISVMSKLNSPYVVIYMGATKVPTHPLCLVMEYVPEGSLKKLLKKALSFNFKVKLATDIAKGLSYLHSNSIAHRDMKPDNVLVVSSIEGANVNVKLTDFGTSRCDACYKSLQESNYVTVPAKKDKEIIFSDTQRSTNTSSRTLTKGVGTLIYSAPEILNGKTAYDTQKTDIYSYGILLLELFTQKEPFSDPPYDKYSNAKIAQHVIGGGRVEIPQDLNTQVAALIKRCWEQDPDKRPPCKEILSALERIKEDSPQPYPSECQPEIGWAGEIERGDAETLLKDEPHGTFLFRYNKKQASFVLSYKDTQSKELPKPYQHINGITQNGPKETVVHVTTKKGVVLYSNFLDYVRVMQKNGFITEPLKRAAPVQQDEGIYSTTNLNPNYAFFNKQ